MIRGVAVPVAIVGNVSAQPLTLETLISLTHENLIMSDTSWTIGETVLDRDDPDADPAIVVNTPSAPAEEWIIPRIDKTVAKDNPDYPTDAAVAVVVYEDDLDRTFPEWGHDQPIAMTDLNNAHVDHYSFPAPRLERDHSNRSTAETTTNGTTEGDTNAERGTSEHEDEGEADTVEDDIATPRGKTGADTTAPSNALPELSPELLALEERLEDGGMTVELDEENQTLHAEKLGQSYHLRPGEVLAGDGALRDRLEDIVTDDAFDET